MRSMLLAMPFVYGVQVPISRRELPGAGAATAAGWRCGASAEPSAAAAAAEPSAAAAAAEPSAAAAAAAAAERRAYFQRFPTLFAPLYGDAAKETVRRQVGDGIWVLEQNLELGPLQTPLRCVVVRLRDGGLWVHA